MSTLLSNSTFSEEVFTFKLKGSKKAVEICFQVAPEDEDVLMVMVTDVTSVRSLHKEKQLQRMKTIYFCSVAHDLKTPLNSINATNDFLLSKLGSDRQLRKLLQVTKSSC
mmetsp:Transcript_30372/g.22545  ORF Transcript_30372/g.22545 Transcript_30372/m.22545 type:complete len:110 (+) Transcript_30372:739-1068(+)|eukprot:CAMPEP_0202960584 /NCGR_PEP_ID=MMETSP1396-20130829/4732_1 /ASSEMBLY_ACC=CAM_ASM_000872 /TAXON_ID= /ORGANISM="Pseudokeronopsis sp., Strain Brazil" /LENGTH=109 /DNA_ID=CAMNT_0049679889 /DNA_START=728 /DNA_END=1057 /DNA_ORIENTATION=-